MRRPIPHKKLIILAGVLIIVIAAGLLAFRMLTKKNEHGSQPAPVQKETLVLFCPGTQGMLKKKTVEIGNDVPEKARAGIILAELKKENAIPETLAIRDVATDSEGIMYLNLSHDIKTDEMGTLEEIATLYSIVNSFLSNFKSSKKIQFLIEGQTFHTLNGLLYTYGPIEFNNNLVEE